MVLSDKKKIEMINTTCQLISHILIEPIIQFLSYGYSLSQKFRSMNINFSPIFRVTVYNSRPFYRDNKSVWNIKFDGICHSIHTVPFLVLTAIPG